MKTQGRENATWGYTAPSDGWHTFRIKEGIVHKTKDNGKSNLMIPLEVSEGGDEDGRVMSLFINTFDENNKEYRGADQMIADVVLATGLQEGFNKAFPGDVGFLDPKVMDMVKIKLSGAILDAEVTSKKDKEGNLRPDVNKPRKAGSMYGKAPKASAPSGKPVASKSDDPWG